MKNTSFYKQAELVVRLLPIIFKEKCYALKGGTAINFFVRDLPRLSVDIDLVYMPIKERQETLREIKASLNRCTDAIVKALPGAQVNKVADQKEAGMKLVVRYKDASVKIEPNFIIRGTVSGVREVPLTKSAQNMFDLFVAVPVVSNADLYGGKLCAALDRQHPRDLFDVKLLLEHEGITADIRKAFIVYLASHDRTMHDLLSPSIKNIKGIFDAEFSGMTITPVSLPELINVQKHMGKMILDSLTGNEKQFLLSFKKGEPQWQLLDLEDIEKLPAIRWKLLNIKKMSKRKHSEQAEKLQSLLGL